MDVAHRGLSGLQASVSSSALPLHSCTHNRSTHRAHERIAASMQQCALPLRGRAHPCRLQGLPRVDPHHCGLESAQRRQQQRLRAALRALPGSADAADLHDQLLSMQRLSGNAALGDLGDGLEAPVQLLYLLTLLGFLVVGAYLVVRQVLVRRELEEAAKVLGERIRTNEASCEDCFELGVILLRKKLYTQATKNLEKAVRIWDGAPEELAQVHNALGFAYFNMERTELALRNYGRAVELQPGYVTAWNNLGDAQEKAKDWAQALKAYEEALSYSPENKIARSKVESLRTKVGRLNMS